jgi:hypothetical protein
MAVAAYWFLTLGPGQRIVSPPESTVLQFSGSGDQTTPPFQVREAWDIQWESMGDRFSLAIRGDRDFGTVIEVDEAGSGVTSPTGAGSYYLEVTADGAWSVRITQGD